jgi:hypothetical protein
MGIAFDNLNTKSDHGGVIFCAFVPSHSSKAP